MKKVICLFIVMSLLLGCLCSCKNTRTKGVFLGIEDSKNVTKVTALDSESCIYQFKINGKTKNFCVDCTKSGYPIQNRLMMGYEYYLDIDSNKIKSVEIVDKSNISGIVKGYTPGEKTLKNFLSATLAPIGNTIYVFGGGWNFQDSGSSYIARTIGVSPTWEKFYKTTDANYSYKNDTYPVNGWNEYYYAGLDCSGFVGWSIYNTLYSENEQGSGFVCSSRKIAKFLADNNYGSFVHSQEKDYKKLISSLHAGDVVSMDGHTYIVFGVCDDDSAVIVHSTVTSLELDVSGGGVQLSAISADGENDTNCKAYKLAKKYMEENFPEWTKKYPVVIRPANRYLNFPNEYETTGIFTWHFNRLGLTDEENLRSKTADEILETVFKNRIG